MLLRFMEVNKLRDYTGPDGLPPSFSDRWRFWLYSFVCLFGCLFVCLFVRLCIPFLRLLVRMHAFHILARTRNTITIAGRSSETSPLCHHGHE